MRSRFYVLLVDLVGSQRLKDRERVGVLYRRVLAAANRSFAADLLAPLEITRGDEAAAVLRRCRRSYDLMATLGDRMAPVNVRFVLLYDELTSGLRTRRSSLIDGPGFQRADRAMQALKRTRFSFDFTAAGEPPPAVSPALVALVNLLQWRWRETTPLQRRVLRLYERRRHQSLVAEEIGRTQQQVSQILRAARWDLLEQGEEATRRLLELLDERLAAQARS